MLKAEHYWRFLYLTQNLLQLILNVLIILLMATAAAAEFCTLYLIFPSQLGFGMAVHTHSFSFRFSQGRWDSCARAHFVLPCLTGSRDSCLHQHWNVFECLQTSVSIGIQDGCSSHSINFCFSLGSRDSCTYTHSLSFRVSVGVEIVVCTTS